MMSGLFSGLEIGKSALATHQLWMNIIGHNIANANTPGYTRQRVETTSSIPLRHPVGPVGTGVTALGVKNVRDLFLNQQYRQESQNLAKWSASEKTIKQIEQIFYEPSEGSLSSLMNKFWDGWSDVATEPENQTFRNSLLINANQLTGAFHQMHDQLLDLQKAIDDDIRLSVKNINSLAEEVAALNLQIARTELGNDHANDLRDRRDYILDQLSQYANVNVIEDSTGASTVFIGSMTIVEKDQTYKLSTYELRDNNVVLHNISWAGSKSELHINGGEINGLIETRDKIIPRYLNSLDEMARALVTNINAIHQTGYDLDGNTGLNFFDPFLTSAGNIRISDDIGAVPERIAAASEADAIGNNIIALALADLRNANLMKNASMSITEYYQNLVGKIGAESSRAQIMKGNMDLLVAKVDNSRQSVQGVSLDEEMANLVKYQHAYDAAARVITTMDQALETVINKMGMVGR